MTSGSYRLRQCNCIPFSIVLSLFIVPKALFHEAHIIPYSTRKCHFCNRCGIFLMPHLYLTIIGPWNCKMREGTYLYIYKRREIKDLTPNNAQSYISFIEGINSNPIMPSWPSPNLSIHLQI